MPLVLLPEMSASPSPLKSPMPQRLLHEASGRGATAAVVRDRSKPISRKGLELPFRKLAGRRLRQIRSEYLSLLKSPMPTTHQLGSAK